MSFAGFNHEQTIALIWEIEANFDLAELKVNDISVWPILRQVIYGDNIFISKTSGAVPQARFKKLKAAGSIAFERFLDRKHNQVLGRADVYFLSHTTSRTAEVAGKWQDYIVMPLVNAIGKIDPVKSVHIDEYAPGGEYRCPRNEPSDYMTLSLTKAFALGMLFPLTLTAQFTLLIDEITKFIRDRGGIAPSLQTASLCRRLTQFLRCVQYFESKLNTISPSIIFVVCFYSLPGMALMHAGRRLGITTVDLQHGVQGEAHSAYGSWYAQPADGYSCLPDYFWVWSEREQEALQSLAPAHRTVVGGNIQMAYWSDKRHAGQLKLQELIEKSGRRQVVLVTLQPGGEHLVKELLQAIDSRACPDCFWLIRLHPAMILQYQERLNLELQAYQHCCESLMVSKLPLPVVLELIDAHLTLFSSVTIEAGQLGIPTLICDRSSNFFEDLVRKGFARIRKPEVSFIDTLHEFLKWCNEQPALPAYPDSAEKMASALIDLLGKSGGKHNYGRKRTHREPAM
jgi:hypothetical protein